MRSIFRARGRLSALATPLLLLLLAVPGCGDADAAASLPGRASIAILSSTPGRVGSRVMLSASTSLTPLVYRWRVTAPDYVEVPVTKDGDGSRASFTPEQPGTYRIEVEIDVVEYSYPAVASGSISVDSSDNQRVYQLQVVTPDTIGAPTTQKEIVVGDGDRVGVSVTVDDGIRVSMAVRDGLGELRPAFVSVWGQLGGPLLVDRFLPDGTTALQLSGTFDALVVPVGDGLAPKRFAGLRASSLISGWNVKLDAGLAVRGQVYDGRVPLADAVVTVRSADGFGAVPSTVGHTDAQGRYSLRARAGKATLTVVPPAGSGRPIARVQDVALDGDQSGWRFAYADRPRVRFDAVVTQSDGSTPAAGARVVVEAAQMVDVGELRTANGALYKALGHVKRELVTDASGRLVEPGSSSGASSGAAVPALMLPAGTYSVSLTPGNGAPSIEGPRTVAVELTAGQAKLTTLSLARRVVLSGKVESDLAVSSAGAVSPVRASVKVTDSHGRVFSTVTDSRGVYQVNVDDGQTYSVFVRPLVDRPTTSGQTATIIGPVHLEKVQVNGSRSLDVKLPRAVRIEGWVQTSGDLRIGDAIVRVLCTGAAGCPPSRVLDETRTRADGTFQLRVPLPEPTQGQSP